MDSLNPSPFSFSANDLITVPDDGRPKYKILIVEDDDDMARHMLTTLARAGMECRHTSDSQVGIEALRPNDFHLLLLDLSLPQHSGQELCRRARQISTLPIIVLMEQEEQEAQMKCFGLGADDYLIKPFSSHHLLLRVVSLLRRSYVYNHKKHKHNVPISSIPLAAPLRPVEPQNSIAATSPETENESGELPAGWSRCDACHYIGPTQKFSIRRRDRTPGHGVSTLRR